MAFNWTKYLELAKALSETQDEASLRSAVSRSYYCVYNMALERAQANGYRHPEDGSGGSHELLWRLYGRNEDKSCQRLALSGPRMKRRRVKADYSGFSTIVTAEVKAAINDADECVALLAGLAQNLPEDIPRKFTF